MKNSEENRIESPAREIFSDYVNLPFYKVEWHTDHKTGEKSDPWLTWAPSKYPIADDELASEVTEFIEERISKRQIFSWSLFLDTGEEEIFGASSFYGDRKERSDKLNSVIDRLKKGIHTVDDSVHSAEVGKLESLQAVTRSKLEDHADELWDYVLSPLRDALLPCLIESYRDLIGFGNWKDADQLSRSRWRTTLGNIRRLWSMEITKGIPREDMLCAQAFNRVPGPVAEGAMVALSSLITKTHVPKNEVGGEVTDLSRNGILKRAQPIYFRWIGARLMVKSALYGRKLKEVVDEFMSVARPDRTRRELLLTYNPSSGVDGLLEAISELQNEGHGLKDSRSREAIYRFAVNKKNLGLKAPRSTLESDMKRKKVHEGLWPENTTELVEIAQMYCRLK